MPHTAVSYRSIDADGIEDFYREAGPGFGFTEVPEERSFRESYLNGVPGSSAVTPEAWWLDSVLSPRPGNAEIQMALMVDYASNVALHPKFQGYFREAKPNLLAVWERDDPFFVPAGSEAFRRDIPELNIQFVNAGHFALETDVHAIALAILEVVPGFFW